MAVEFSDWETGAKHINNVNLHNWLLKHNYQEREKEGWEIRANGKITTVKMFKNDSNYVICFSFSFNKQPISALLITNIPSYQEATAALMVILFKNYDVIKNFPEWDICRLSLEEWE